jgi:hypothetical protein
LDRQRGVHIVCSRRAGGWADRPISFGIGTDPGHQEHPRPSTSVPTEASASRSTKSSTRSRLTSTACVAVDHLLPLLPSIRGSSYRRNRFGSLPSSISYSSSQAGSERTMASNASYAFPRLSYCLDGLDNFRSCHNPRTSQCMLAIPLIVALGPHCSCLIAKDAQRSSEDGPASAPIGSEMTDCRTSAFFRFLEVGDTRRSDPQLAGLTMTPTSLP